MGDSKTPSLRPDDIGVGDWIDVRDASGLWCGCRVVEKSAASVLVQPPQRWSNSADPWLPWSSPRLAYFRQHSQGSGLVMERRPATWEQTISECQRCTAQLAALQAVLPELSAESSWTPVRITSLLCGEVPDMVDSLLGHDYLHEGAAVVALRVLEANRFFLQFLQFFCAWLHAVPHLFRVPVRASSGATTASATSSCTAACAAAFADLAAVFGRVFSASDRRATTFFEGNVGLPEKSGIAAVWPGADSDWLRRVVSSGTNGGTCEVNDAAVPLAWLLVKLKGLEDASGPIDVSTLEEALRKSTLLHCNVVAFCAMGGVEELIAALSSGGETTVPDKDFRVRPLPLEGLRASLLPLSVSASAQNIGRSWLEFTLPRVLAAIRTRIVTMWDEEVKVVDRDHFFRCICDPAIHLMAAKCSRAELDETREELLLLFSRRRLQSPFLEKRLKALTDVKELVDRTSPRSYGGWNIWSGRDRDASASSRKPSGSENSATARNEPLLSAAGLAQWIADDERYGLLPILFGARAHPEVLRRANFILRLLAREQMLTCERLDALWLCGCSADKHEGLTCCVLDMLVEIAPALDRTQIEFLVGKVVSMSAHSIDVKFISFLRDFLLAAVKNRQSYGIEDASASSDTALGDGLSVFWRLLRAEAALGPLDLLGSSTPKGNDDMAATASDASEKPAVNPTAVKQARKCFLVLLQNPHFANHRSRHLHVCWNALHDGLIDTSLVKLFRELLDTFPATAASGSSGQQRDAVLWRLSNEDGKPQLSVFLLDCAINALQLCPAWPANSVATPAFMMPETANTSSGGAPVDNTPEAARENGEPGASSCRELVRTILDTLLYALTESSLQINFEDMDRLWRAVKDGTSHKRDMVAAWLSHVAGFTFAAKVFKRPNWEVWPEFEYVHFFQGVLRSNSENNFKLVSHDVLVCFVNYMKLCNMKIFNSSLHEDMIYIPETPNCSSLHAAGNSGYASGPTYPAFYSQLIGRDGSAKTGELAAAVGKRFRVLRWGLLGHDELWEIAMQVMDASVFEHCGDFLVSCVVFLHRCSNAYTKRTEVNTTFLQRCMQTLESPDAGDEGARCVHKVLALLAKFLSFSSLSNYRNQESATWPVAAEPEPSQRNRKSRSDLASSFHIGFRSDNSSGSMRQKTVYLQKSETLGRLRSKVASSLQLQPKELGLYTCPGMQSLSWDWDCLTLEECQVPSSLYAAYAKQSSTHDASAVWQLSEKELDTFLDLLAASGTRFRCEDPVWAILGYLPVHERITSILIRVSKWGLEVGVLGGRRPLAHLLNEETHADLPVHVPLPGGSAALATRDVAAEFSKFWHGKVWHWCTESVQQRRPQMHRLLYALRVIHSLMLGQEAPSESNGEHLVLQIRSSVRGQGGGDPLGESWSRGFLLSGGLELFLDVFAVLYTCHDGLQCLSLLAHIIRELLERWSAGLGRSAPSDLDGALRSRLPALVPQLMEVLRRVVHAEYDNEKRELASFTSYSANVVHLCSSRPSPTDETLVATPGAKAPESHESACVARVFTLLHLALCKEGGCAVAFHGYDRTAEILKGGFFSSDSAVREATATGVHNLCSHDPSDDGSLGGGLLKKLLFDVLPLWEQEPLRSDQVFHLIARLLQRHRSPQPAAMGLVLQPNHPAPCLEELHGVEGNRPIAKLLDSLVAQLSAGTCTFAEDKSDGTMLAMLELIHSILHCFPQLKGPASQTLAGELLRSCLGPAAVAIPTLTGNTHHHDGLSKGAPRCQTNQSRQAAFALLHELATDNCEACLSVTQLLLAALVRPSARSGARWHQSEWVIHPDLGMKSASGFVGLKNFGATCYMNSVLQQLFAHPEFQVGVLTGVPVAPVAKHDSAEDTEEARTAKTNSKELLYQLQVLFSSLRSSQRQYYSPKGFCAAFRDWSGRPVNVLQQMDADEFLNLLMDQLERVMGSGSGRDTSVGESSSLKDGKESAQKNLVRRCFGGTLCTEIIPKDSVAGRSERLEDFLVLSLQVKGKQSVRASLEAFVEGEMLEGDNAYFSEEAGCKVDALKRTCLSSLPETLILVLKRFEFDFDTMQKVKLNDLCEFPMQLDMWPYSKNGLDAGPLAEAPNNSLEYVLKGIVLHSGTADSGHYSSLVKINVSEHDTQWYEFNDTVVTPVNEEDIPQEAFGGLRDDDNRTQMGSGLTSNMGIGGRSKNAYLLFYEKATVACRSTTGIENVGGSGTHDMQDADSTDTNHAKDGEAIQQSVEAGNRKHWHTQAIFSTEFADFAWMFATNFFSSPALLASKAAAAPHAESVGALKFMQLAQLRRDCPSHANKDVRWEDRLPLLVCNFVASFIFTILARSRDRHSLTEWCSLLCRMVQRAGLPSQRWFGELLACHGFVREVLLECPVLETRVAHLGVVTQILRWIFEGEVDALRSFIASAPAGDMHHGRQWGEKPTAPSTDVSKDAKEPPVLVKIWATLVELLPAASQIDAHLRFAQFFELLQEFLLLGPETLAWASKAGGLDALIEFVLQDEHPRALKAAQESAQKWYQPNWLQVLHPVDGDGPKLDGVGDVVALRPVGADLVRGIDNSGTSTGPASIGNEMQAEHFGSADAAFERQLQNDGVGELIELGPIWRVIALLLQNDAKRLSRHDEENDSLLRRVILLGGISATYNAGAGRLLRLLCKGDLVRSQTVVCRICERIDESDGQALRGALRMGSALVMLADGLTQQRLVYMLKSVLHVAKNNRKYFRIMHFVIHYVVRWCRRRPELPQWLALDAGGSSRCLEQYRWLEQWLKEKTGGGGGDWQTWQAGPYPGNFASSLFGDNVEDAGRPTRWTWCADMLPYVRKILRGEALSKEAIAPAPGDSDEDVLDTNAARNRLCLLPPSAGSTSASQMPVLSKVHMATVFAAAQQRQQQQALASTGGMNGVAAW